MTRYLVDTHVWLWFSVSPERLSEGVRTALVDPANEAWVSVASVWELAIKSSLAKIALPGTLHEFIAANGPPAGFQILSIQAHHAAAVARLQRHHSDPFDHLLICQAQLEGMTLVTADAQIPQYHVETLWATL